MGNFTRVLCGIRRLRLFLNSQHKRKVSRGKWTIYSFVPGEGQQMDLTKPSSVYIQVSTVETGKF